MERFYGYGIVDKDGYTQLVMSLDRGDLEGAVGVLNNISPVNDELKPYRIVELFYKDEQSREMSNAD